MSCHRVATRDGYIAIDGTVRLARDAKMQSNVQKHIQLTFRYERRPMGKDDVPFNPDGTHVWYSIDYAKDHGKRERLLTVEVWCPGPSPSALPAMPLEPNDDDDDGWEDMDEDEEEEEDDTKGIKANDDDAIKSTNDGASDQSADSNDSDDGPRDRYAAFLDPNVLDSFLYTSGLELHEGTAFFLLMTFPFYEHEWDLIGFVLEVVFGGEDDSVEMIDEDDSGDDDDEE